MMKVKSYMSTNQAIINDGNRVIFQSYKSIIAIVESGHVSLSADWDYSSTTMKYLCKFLNHVEIEEVKTRVKSGEYKVDIDTRGNLL